MSGGSFFTVEHDHRMLVMVEDKDIVVLSTPTPPISLNDQPGGSFAQFSIGSYE
jgi:hypothetical protein